MKFLNFSLAKVQFKVNRKFKPKATEVNISPQIALNHEVRTEEKQLIVMLGIRQRAGNIPYYFEVEALSLFHLDENETDEKILKQLADINCPAIIFPYVRETIADLTRRAGFPPLHLNPINFVQLAKERESEQKGEEKIKK